MNTISFKAMRKFKRIGVFHGIYDNDVNSHEKYIITNTSLNLHIGDVLITEKTNDDSPPNYRKLHITDILPTNFPGRNSNQIKIYYETDWEYKKQLKQFRHDWFIASYSILTGAVSGVLASIIYHLIIQK